MFYLTKKLSTIKATNPACMIMDSNVHQSVLSSGLTSRVKSSECSSAAWGTRWSYKGSAILPSASHQGVSLLAPWHNWQTVWCHLTPLSMQPFSPSSLVKRKRVESEGVFLSCWLGPLNSMAQKAAAFWAPYIWVRVCKCRWQGDRWIKTSLSAFA